MRIGFDFDKVFIDYPPFFPSKIIDRLYKEKDNGVLLYRIPSKPEQLMRKATHLPFLRPGIKNNLSFLKEISKKDNQLFLISSRFKFLEKETYRLIRKHKLDHVFDGLYFNFENKQPHLFKDEVIQKLKLDLYIDDDLSLLRHVAKGSEKTFFFWLNPKNNLQKVTSNIYAIKKLSDIVSFMTKPASMKEMS